MTDPDFDQQVEHLLEQCEAQGFPRHVDDPAVVAKIAAILAASRREVA